MDWSGAALLISSQTINPVGNVVELTDDEQAKIAGGTGYSCTNILQVEAIIECAYFGGECAGYYQEYFTRYGCEAAESGSCSSTKTVGFRERPCIEDPYNPWDCITYGNWIFHYMKACN
jgi:hypothetical protein